MDDAVCSSQDIVGSDGSELARKKIVLCVSGSVAAYKSIELARLLMRRGATVEIVASAAATRLITPDYFEWAVGKRPLVELTGRLEHVNLADYGRADLVIAYPATANTMGKLANGIDDTPVSTVLTVALGSRTPIMVGPAMHRAMYDNIAVRRNIEFLRDTVEFVDPRISEGKAKAAEPEEVLERVLERFAGALRSKSILVCAGPTVENIDTVRTISNTSTGLTGALLAEEMGRAGARITMVYGPGSAEPPGGITLARVRTAEQMREKVTKLLDEQRFDAVVMAAAVSDYVPAASDSKLPGNRPEMRITLKRVPKIINNIKKRQPDAFLVGFKAETDISRAELEKRAKQKMAESGADMMVANDVGTKYQRDTGRNSITILSKTEKPVRTGRKTKREIARILCREIARHTSG